jgi:hypothetical protein
MLLLRSWPDCVFVVVWPSTLVVWSTVQFPEVWQSAWTRFVWPLSVSLSCFEVWLTTNVSAGFPPVCVEEPLPLLTWSRWRPPVCLLIVFRTLAGPYCTWLSE